MQKDYLDYQSKEAENPDFSMRFRMPSFKRETAYVFDSPELELYHELNEISEEVGRCRRNQLT